MFFLMKLDEFFNKCWSIYSVTTPDAPLIHRLLKERGEQVLNDHVAFRTFNLPGISRLELGKIFEDWGYRRADEELDFPEKKLKASYYLHPDSQNPKVFISELLLERVSKDLQEWIRDFTSPSMKSAKPSAEIFLKPAWKPVRYAEYQRFYSESEYAAWTAAFSIQVNHFTVFVNSLSTFKSLQELNAFLKSHGMKLNASGGEVKGTPDQLLEQSSTEARRIPWKFAENETQNVMGCYYEFARRYPLPGTDQLFQGFIPASADKIFESTFEKKK